MLMLDICLGSDCNTERFISNYVLVTQNDLMNIYIYIYIFFAFSECCNFRMDKSRASYNGLIVTLEKVLHVLVK